MVTKPITSLTTDATASNNSSTASNRESGPAPKGTAASLSIAERPRNFRDAFLLTGPERAQLLQAELLNPGPLDVTFAVTTALSAVVRLDQRRDQIAARFAEELVEIDKLDTYARATAHAAMLVNTTLAPAPKLQTVYDAALVARRLLVSDLSNATIQSLISPEAVDRLSNDAGYTNVANDILAAVQFFTQGGADLIEKIATPLEKLTEYEQLAYELIELSSRRMPQAVTAEEARDELQRSLTLLLRAYGTAEKVMAFFDLRDQAYRKVVPSLYGNKTKSRKGASESETDESAEPTSPTTAGIEDVSEGAASAALGATDPAVAGARGGSPFVSRTPKP